MGKDATAARAAGSPTGNRAANPYVAVVHFHGIGSQRRLEESARMIDALDSYARRHRGNEGLLSEIEPQLESRRDGGDGIEPYVRAKWQGPRPEDRDAPWPATEIRFYEVYWAPVLAEGRSWRRTSLWFLSQVKRPFVTLTTPWRERQRLRRAALMELGEGSVWSGISDRDFDIQQLVARYDAFEGLDAHARWPRGRFRDFIAFVETQFGVEPGRKLAPDKVARLVALARLWRRRYVRTELRVFAILSTFMLALVLAVAGALWGAFQLALLLGGASQATATSLGIAGISPDPPQLALLIASAALGLFGLKRLVTDYVGDIEVWSTFAETDEKHRLRREVLGCGTGLLAHILMDRTATGEAACGRLVITSHSLGTAIANDSLLALARQNRATPRGREFRMEGRLNLRPIEHFVTLGSPIDKIEYFFESSRSQSHRYRRVVEDLRGDIGAAPFLANRRPHIHWINIWDDADPVAGALHSPASGARNQNQVDNHHVKGFAFPLPARSHTAYFEQCSVVGMLFDIIIHRKLSFAAMSPEALKSKAYAALILGEGHGVGDRAGVQMAMLALPWLVLAALLLAAVGWMPLWTALSVPGGLALLLGLGAVFSRRSGVLDPIGGKADEKRSDATPD